MAKDPQDDDDLKLCSHTMMLPTRGQLEGRMIVTAYEHGLDNVTEEAVSAVVYAVEVGLLEAESHGLHVTSCVWSEVAAAVADPTVTLISDLSSFTSLSSGETHITPQKVSSLNRRSFQRGYLRVI